MRAGEGKGKTGAWGKKKRETERAPQNWGNLKGGDILQGGLFLRSELCQILVRLLIKTGENELRIQEESLWIWR